MNIVIVGGGFGGVKAALELAKDAKNRVLLISDKPDFQYYPALFSTATGHSHLQSWVPLDQIFGEVENVEVRLDTITKINPELHEVQGMSGEKYGYDKCVLALGSVTTFFGIKGLDTFAYGIKSADEIKRLKRHLYTEVARDHEMDKHYVVIGAGPTGTELAAALGTYLEHLRQHYGLKKHSIKIDLIEAAPRVLPRMSESSSRRVLTRLKALGVDVQTGRRVEREDKSALLVDGQPIHTQTVIWTSGVANNPFFKDNAQHFKLAPNGRVLVDKHMRVNRDLYVIGDNAVTKYGGLAQTALHDARYVADDIKRREHGRKTKVYKPVQPAVVVPVGRDWAVFEWHGIKFGGRLGALVRSLADWTGYHDILPFGQALGIWRADRIVEDDYFEAAKPGEL